MAIKNNQEEASFTLEAAVNQAIVVVEAKVCCAIAQQNATSRNNNAAAKYLKKGDRIMRLSKPGVILKVDHVKMVAGGRKLDGYRQGCSH